MSTHYDVTLPHPARQPFPTFSVIYLGALEALRSEIPHVAEMAS
jgi:hypothetical protein